MENPLVYWAKTGVYPPFNTIIYNLSSEDKKRLVNMKYFLTHKINTLGQLTIFLMDLVEILDYEDESANELNFHMIRKWFLGNLALCLEGRPIYPHYDQPEWADKLLESYSFTIEHYVELGTLCYDQKSILSSYHRIITLIGDFFTLDCFLRNVSGSNCDGLHMLIDAFNRDQNNDFENSKN